MENSNNKIYMYGFMLIVSFAIMMVYANNNNLEQTIVLGVLCIMIYIAMIFDAYLFLEGIKLSRTDE